MHAFDSATSDLCWRGLGILEKLNPRINDSGTVSDVVQMLRTVIPPPSTVDAIKLYHCTQELLRRTQPMMLKTYIPVHVDGYGNNFAQCPWHCKISLSSTDSGRTFCQS